MSFITIMRSSGEYSLIYHILRFDAMKYECKVLDDLLPGLLQELQYSGILLHRQRFDDVRTIPILELDINQLVLDVLLLLQEVIYSCSTSCTTCKLPLQILDEVISTKVWQEGCIHGLILAVPREVPLLDLCNLIQP